MTSAQEIIIAEQRGLKTTARIVAIFWSFCWILFGIISGVGESIGASKTITQTAFPGIIYLVLSILAFRNDGLGGLLIILAGISTTLYFILQTGSLSLLEMVFMLLYTTVPALLVGFLFIASWKLRKSDHNV